MVDGSVDDSGSQLSSNIIIAIISSLFILIILYPWIVAVTVICFIIGFAGLDHLDRFVKTAIVTGRLGPVVQARFKDYISLDENSESQKNVIKEVTADPLRDFMEEKEQQASNLQQQQQQKQQQQQQQQNDQQTNLHKIQNTNLGNATGIQNSLIIPARISSSNRSSPEKNKPLFDSPKRSLSAASSRRVSEDIPGGGQSTTSNLVAPFAMMGGVPGIYHQNQRREGSNKTPSPSRSSPAASTPSPSITLNPDIVGTLQVDKEFRVNGPVDKAFGRLCNNIINYYISPSWAPYETRRQLKLNFKQLLTAVAEQCNRRLLYHNKLKGGGEGGDDTTTTTTTTTGDMNVNLPIMKLVREKLLPLALHYLDKMMARGTKPQTGGVDHAPIISNDSKRRIVFKIRKFCKQILERFLTKDDKNCKLWMELCIAVLGDGVLVNVMTLGMDKLPELLEELIVRFKKTSRAASITGEKLLLPSMKRSASGNESVKDDYEFIDPLSEDFVEASQEPFTVVHENDAILQATSASHEETVVVVVAAKNKSVSTDKVPFLLDSFLDPPYNLEKLDPIVSRWRPTIKDIVSETDLLYPLIQYMKHVGGQQSLVYLQGVLDEFPLDGDPYCRRVLELEYLPGFCRSSLFLETMGLSRLEVATEVGADPFSVVRRNSNNNSNGGGGHTRSASYGGPSSSFREFLKIEQGIVDGLPLTESSQQNISTSSSSSDHSTGGGSTTSVASAAATFPLAGEIQPSLAFKRRPHLEMYIAKFLKSTSKSWKQFYDPLSDQNEPAKRVGIEAKSYDEWNHPEVNSRVKIECSTGEIYDSFIDLVTSLMRSSPIAGPFFSGLAGFLKPYLMPTFNEHLDKNLTEVLSEDLLVTVADLIADVFEEPTSEEATENDNNETNIPNGSKNGIAKEEYGHPSSPISAFSNVPSSLPSNSNTSEEDSHEYHNSSCTTCDPSLKSTVESFLINILECVMLKLIDLDYFAKCFSKNREFIFLFFVDLLDVLVGEIVEE